MSGLGHDCLLLLLRAASMLWYPLKRRNDIPEQGLVAVQSCMGPGGNKKPRGATMTSQSIHRPSHHRMCWNIRIATLISPREHGPSCSFLLSTELDSSHTDLQETGARSIGRGCSWFLGSRCGWGVWKAMMSDVWLLLPTIFEHLLTAELWEVTTY